MDQVNKNIIKLITVIRQMNANNQKMFDELKEMIQKNHMPMEVDDNPLPAPKSKWMEWPDREDPGKSKSATETGMMLKWQEREARHLKHYTELMLKIPQLGHLYKPKNFKIIMDPEDK